MLLLLPSSSNALEAKWQGPFKVNRKVGPVDYEIETNHKGRKLKVYHVNLLKGFKRRTMESFLGITNVTGDEEGEDHPVLYLSHKLLPRERNYATIEKESGNQVGYLQFTILSTWWDIQCNNLTSTFALA